MFILLENYKEQYAFNKKIVRNKKYIRKKKINNRK